MNFGGKRHFTGERGKEYDKSLATSICLIIIFSVRTY